MKIFVNNAGENWICDRMKKEFVEGLPDLYVNNPSNADIFWAIAPWKVRNFSRTGSRFTLTSIYHIVPEKFDKNRLIYLNQHSDAFHVICEKTKDFISQYITKPIFVAPFWINQSIFHPLEKLKTREELSIPADKFIIGSFQRDTEGHDSKSPKLEKGPDQFCDIVEDISKHKEVHVLLGGWRRQYVVNRLNKSKITFTYIERPNIEVINKMYNCLDLYVVASRHEGGPASIPECAATKTPIISTNVGCAEIYLDKKSIFDFPNYHNAESNCDFAYEQAREKFLPNGFGPFVKMFNSILET